MPAAKAAVRNISTNWAEAVSSVSLISALVFGFSVSTFSERIGDLVGHKLTWLSLVLYIGALAVLAMDKLSGESAILAGFTFLVSAITIVSMGSFLSRQNFAAEKASGGAESRIQTLV